MRHHSGLFYPNQWAMHYFNSYAFAFRPTIADPQAMVYTMLNLGQLTHLSWDRFPPANMAREVDFADLTAYTHVYNDMFSPLVARQIMIDAGIRWFDAMSPQFRLPLSLRAIADLFNENSDQETLYEMRRDHRFVIKRCPFCYRPDEIKPDTPHSWLDKLSGPVCAPWLGFFRAACPTAIEIVETECLAKGGDACVFELRIPAYLR